MAAATKLFDFYSTRRTAKSAAAVGVEMIIDNFAGAGGASLGIEAAMGRCVDVAINHSKVALETHAVNHPGTRHLCGDIWDYKPLKVTGGRPVGLMWASPDCKHFSKAKGGKPVSPRVRGLAWVVIRWAREVRPRVIILENVEEFQDWGPLVTVHGIGGKPLLYVEGRRVLMPDKARKGETFKRWVGQLRKCGYQVECRELVAADYGVPTIRKRLFLIARCDGQPIMWPVRTHAPRGKAEAMGLTPWRSAAECIDWSLPCPSIFERKRPLAEATLRRIANGLRRFVIEAKEPFIVACNHGDHGGDRCRSTAEPVPTVTGSRDAHGLVVPALVVNTSGHAAQDVRNPAATLTTGSHQALVEAFLSKFHGVKSLNESSGTHPSSPLLTQDTSNRFGVVAATVVQTSHGKTTGRGVYSWPSTEPLRTLTSSNEHAVMAAHLAKFRGDSPGTDAAEPMHTITAGSGAARPAGAAHAMGLVTVHMEMFYGSSGGRDAADPMATVTTGGNGGNGHIAEIRAFLVAYYGSGSGTNGRCPREPSPTITARHRLGIVQVEGVDYQISDVGLRMLRPRELLNAQFGRFARDYVLIGTQAQQVAGIGNSVAPEVAEKLVAANLPTAHIPQGTPLQEVAT